MLGALKSDYSKFGLLCCAAIAIVGGVFGEPSAFFPAIDKAY